MEGWKGVECCQRCGKGTEKDDKFRWIGVMIMSSIIMMNKECSACWAHVITDGYVISTSTKSLVYLLILPDHFV